MYRVALAFFLTLLHLLNSKSNFSVTDFMGKKQLNAVAFCVFFVSFASAIFANFSDFGIEKQRCLSYSDQPWKCPKCGLKNPQGIRFCSRCNWPD